MGYGSYTAKDWSRLKTTRSIDESSVNDLFKNKQLLDKFNPKFISMRESREQKPDRDWRRGRRSAARRGGAPRQRLEFG